MFREMMEDVYENQNHTAFNGERKQASEREGDKKRAHLTGH